MTSIQHRFFVDECLPPQLADTYLLPHVELSSLAAEVRHYVDKFGPNSKWKDKDFIPELARDKRWIVLTADKGAKSTYKESMRTLCRIHKVTLVWISSHLHKSGLEYFGPQIMSHWKSVLTAANGPRGSQSHIALKNHRDGARTVFETIECPDGWEFNNGIFEKCK